MALATLIPLAGCVGTGGVTEEGYLTELPEGLADSAAPGQNLTTIRILPEDGCYWYEHVGPVETTILPLRTRDNRPICSRAQGEEAAA
ncbi:hypothetical protein DDE20_01890 [Pararhodobacter oceanensis]|uniref:Uncharacterized protein n=1 Tax=Pararhodobacter oceanensis TaxID=2172121 RepID=A0A2T8HZD5_9RHOB|nr:hypothetical protein DDE20_01890 [Pararhodobacter oceanensis]